MGQGRLFVLIDGLIELAFIMAFSTSTFETTVECQEFEEYKKYPEYQRLHAGKMELDETLERIYA